MGIFHGVRATRMERGAKGAISSEEEGEEGRTKGELHFGVSIDVGERTLKDDSRPWYLYLKLTSQ